MAKGEAKRLQYKPGEKRPEDLPVDAGDYSLTLTGKGKPGLAGWKVKPGKYPSRMVTFAIADTVSEITGKEKTVREFVSASPDAFFKVFDMAAAAGYPEALDVAQPDDENDSENVQALCLEIDKVVDYIEENGVVLSAYLAQDEYEGRMNNKIKRWNAAEASAETENTEPAPEEPAERPAAVARAKASSAKAAGKKR